MAQPMRVPGAVLVHDGSPDGEAALAKALTLAPGSLVIGTAETLATLGDGTEAGPARRPDRLQVSDAMSVAAETGRFWVGVPRSLDAPEVMIGQALEAVGRHASPERPGFALVLLGSQQPARDGPPYERIAAVVDGTGGGHSGLTAFAAARLAARVGARLEVLLTDVPPPSSPMSSSARQDVLRVVRRDELLRLAEQEAEEGGVEVHWHGLGEPADVAEAVLGALSAEEYDLVVSDLSRVRLGGMVRRPFLLRRALEEEAALPVRLARDAPCDVMVVVDGVSLGFLPTKTMRISAVTALAIGSMTVGLAPSAAAKDEHRKVERPAAAADREPGTGRADRSGHDRGAVAAVDGPVTPRVLRKFNPDLGDQRAERYAQEINEAMDAYGIDSNRQQAMFVGQIAHETDGFRTLEEYSSGAQYEGRTELGNTKPGDGWRYKGRGAIQLTGRVNYEAATEEFGVDFVKNPELAADPEHAFDIAAWWWKDHGLNRKAASNNYEGITQTINGGMTGHADRVHNYHLAREAMF